MARAHPVEVELKYRVIDAAAGDAYLAADDVAGFHPASPVRSTQVEDRYIDTADGALARAGFAARLRQTAKGTTVGVKSAVRRVGTGSVHRREELEGPADRTAHPRDWAPSDARSVLLEQAGDAPLVELVTIRQLRRKRILEREGTSVELSLDEVDAVTRSRVVGRFVELEVELVKGNEADLADIDKLLAADRGLAPAEASKLQSALQAIAAAEPKRGRRRSVILPPVDGDEETSGEPEDHGDDPVATSSDAPVRASARTSGSIRTAPGPVAEAGVAPVEAGSDEPNAPTSEPQAAPSPGSTEPPEAEPRRRKQPNHRRATPPPDEAPRDAARPRLTVGKTPGVLPEDHVAEAGRKVLRFHLARMIAREAGTRDGKNAEDLHAMRVATRRQRAAWRVFGGSFRAGRTRNHRARLREVASRLGAVRDLDVQLEGADAYRADLPGTEQRALEPLLAAWRTHRDDARRLLVRELDSDGYRRWLDDYAEFVRHEGTAVKATGPTDPHRVRDTAASRILGAYEHVRAYEPVLRWADVETLHELRIAGKWLRYTLEFVREALGPDADGLIARVTALQDHLGLMHDADVSAHLARDFLVGNAGALSDLESAAIARYLVNREREVTRLQRTVGRPWRGVAGLAFRRALGRSLAGL
jgi:CHAD domain-containing protein/adenylate cyclase class IV